jgi:opacity protein-like surface antigen
MPYVVQQTDTSAKKKDDSFSYFKGTCMKKLHLIATATLAVLCATGAQAQSRMAENGYYGEIGYSAVDVTGAGGGATPHTLRFLIGSELNKGMGLEALYITTTTKDTRVGYDASVRGFGIFVKPKMALTESTELFARLGAMRAEVTAATGGSHTGTDFAYGLGIQTNFTKTVYGQLDYMQSYDKDGVSAKGYTLSLGTRF